jgi:hypothetical protein
MATQTDPRLHLLGIRHHGPGSAALLRQALETINPECVLIEGPPEGDALIRYVAEPGMKPPIALLIYSPEGKGDAPDNANAASFFPFAEFSPEWQAMHWALERNRPVRFIDWPSAVSLACGQQELQAQLPAIPKPHADALDLLAEAAGYDDGESFWNGLVEQNAGGASHAVEVFAAIETAMTEARAQQDEGAGHLRDLRREAFMRTNIRAAMKEYLGPIAVVCGAWHLSALRATTKAADDRALIKDLPRLKVEATWVPWTDSRLSARSGYGAGVISPGWYRHLWSLYCLREIPGSNEFAAIWQARTAGLLRKEGYGAPTASAIEATRLALGLAALRGLHTPGLAEMREAALATFCHRNMVPLSLIEQKLYIGERVGEIDDQVPQMPLARDLTLWHRRTRLKPEDLELEVRLDLRSDAGLLKSTLLHRLNLINVAWGKLVDANSSRGTFREVWMLRWVPELSVALAEALIHGITIELAAANFTVERARATSSITALADLIHAALVADLPEAASACIALLQAAAVNASDITDLMRSVSPLARVLRYGSARKLPEAELRALVHSLSVEVNAGIRLGSHNLDEESAAARVAAMEAFDETLILFADESLSTSWRTELGRMVDDDQVAAPVAGLSLRRLHDLRAWSPDSIAAAFARNTGSRTPQHSGPFLEGFLRGGSEIILQDEPLLQLMDVWLCSLSEDEFMESLPLVRRSLSTFDTTMRRRLLDKLKRGPRQTLVASAPFDADITPAFAAALPLLFQILGIEDSQP